ncbi:MAG TPA: PAS domain S-box protein [Candidatus Obscuribacterales bacterium]
MPFSGIFLLFGGFIISCATTHVLEVWTLWHPTYWLSGFMKAFTAAISVYTAMLLVKLIPKALTLPSTAQLEAANAKMEAEITQRKIAEVALQKLNEQLELRVEQRTTDLMGAIEELENKIAERKQAEAALRQSEERFRSLVSNIPGAVYRCLCDSNWTIQFISDAIEEISGYPASDFIGNGERDLLSIIHPEDQAVTEKSVFQALEKRQSYIIEYRIIRADGEIRWLYGKGQGIFENNGKILWLDGIIFDITDRKQAESALEVSNRKIANILESIADAFFALDHQWQFTYINRQAEPLLQKKAEELLGKNIWDEYPEAVGSTFYNHYHKAISEQITVAFEEFLSPLDRWLEIRAYPGEDGLSVYFRDITERKQAEEERLRLANNIRLLLESTGEGIYGIDLEGRCTFINKAAAEMIGYKPDEVLGKDMHELIHHSHNDGSFYPGEKCPIYLTFHHGQSCRVDSEILWRRDGTAFPTEYSSYPIIEGELIKGAVVIFADITQRKLSEEALRQSEAREREKSQQLEIALRELKQTQTQLIHTEKMSSLGQLVAGVAHEINNPVNFIYGNLTHAKEYTHSLLNLVKLYQENYPQPIPEINAEVEAIDLDFLMEDLPKLLSSMKVGTDRIRDIVLSLRNFSRLDEAEMKTVDLHEGIDSTLLILQNRLKGKPNHPDIQVIKEYGDLPKVECYAGQLNQVFMNILTNAIDALDDYSRRRSPEEIKQNPGKIWIRTQVLGGFKVAIQIADNGSGMTDQVRSRLFDPFFTTKPVGQGTGLGMSISYQIVVEKHRGQLKCISAPMQGAEFVIEIPIQQSKNKLVSSPVVNKAK